MSMCVQVTHRSGRAEARSRPGKQRERRGPTVRVAFGKQHEPSRWECLHRRSPEPANCIQQVSPPRMLYSEHSGLSSRKAFFKIIFVTDWG